MANKLICEDGYLSFDILNYEHREKVAAFDYDHTLVKPCQGTFSKNVDDWMWLRNNVVEILQEIYNSGYAIVIFTNQSKNFKVEQIKNVLRTLEIPLKVYIGVDNLHKKPEITMWNLFTNEKNIDMNESFFVGDALGRVGDWSDSDKQFADACKLSIRTPEEMFPFDIKSSLKFIPSPTQEFILMMGYQGSGKTTYTLNEIPDSYIKLHGDELKTDAKKKKAVKTYLEQGHSVVLDATNPSKEKRKMYIEIAKAINVPVRIVHITTDFEQSKSRNANREIKVPLIAMYVYRKKYEQPGEEEEVIEIISV